jgi:predicted DNA-binding transcriptional regulator
MKNDLEKLSAIEQAILRMIVGEMTDNEIAFALDISENTVKTHIKNIFGKLKSLTELPLQLIQLNTGWYGLMYRKSCFLYDFMAKVRYENQTSYRS